MRRRIDPGCVVQRAGAHAAILARVRRAELRAAEDPRAAIRAHPASGGAAAVGEALDRSRLAARQAERGGGDDDRHRERAAGHALAVAAMAGIGGNRRLGDLVAQLAALAAAGQWQLHGPYLPEFCPRIIPVAGLVPRAFSPRT